jgi:hypothetical protein
MPPSNRKIVHIVPTHEHRALSKAQKQFNTLTQKIDAEKQRLVEWQEAIQTYNRKVTKDYDVQVEAFNAERIKMAQLLDRAYGNKLFKKTDKAKIQHLIREITAELIGDHGKAELKDLHDKHSDVDFDTVQQETDAIAGDFLKTMMEDLYGVEIEGDIDLSSPEQMEALLHEKLKEQEDKEAERQRQREERRHKRKKTAKQREQEAQQQEQEQSISQSIRDVYRKLTSALHPDREQDPAERTRKTEIMQRVNAAYTKKDLLRLLELQLEAEQIDQAHMNNIAEDRLKYINKILKGQLDELQQEIAQVEFPFKMQLNMPPFMPLSPKRLLQQFAENIRAIKRDTSRLREELRAYQDPAVLKASLKGYKIPKDTSFEDLDELFFDDLVPPFRYK